MMMTADFQSLLIKLQRALEILQLTVYPTNAVGHTRKPERVTIATGHFNRFVEYCQGFGHTSQVSVRESKKEHRGHQQKTIAQLRSELPALNLTLNRTFVFGLEKIE